MQLPTWRAVYYFSVSKCSGGRGKKRMLETCRHLARAGVYPEVRLTLDQGLLTCPLADGKCNMRNLQQKSVTSLSPLDSVLMLI